MIEAIIKLAGGIVALIVMIVGWFLGKKIKKEINKKKQEANEAEARKKGNEALNKMARSGRGASAILKAMKKLREEREKKEKNGN